MSAYGSRSSLYSGDSFAPSAASQAEVRDTSRVLDGAWIQVQKKAFTKWINDKLRVRQIKVEDLANDLSDGVALIQLLEVIGDESLGRFNKNPKLRIQKVENMNTALAFIKRRGVHLTNIGSEDLVDSNEKLALGLIWTLILRFTIADISEEGLTAKEGLLLWCQRKTAPYAPLVAVKDFTFSWQDGLAFCALIHRHRPDLLDFNALDKSDKKSNLNHAFEVAQTHLSIPKLLDAEDLLDLVKPDERSIMTYLAYFFHTFSAMDRFEVTGRRINKFITNISSALEMKTDYENRARALLDAIDVKRDEWLATQLADSFMGAKGQSQTFTTYKQTTKRSWQQEKIDLQQLLGNVTTKLSTYKMKAYVPPSGLALTDLDQAFASLSQDEASFKTKINKRIKEIKEKLQLEFATLANELHSDLNRASTVLADVSGDLEDQSSRVTQLQTEFVAIKSKLTHLCKINSDCVAAGVEENEHTVLSVDDIDFDLGIIEAAVTKRLGFIENQRIARQMDGISPQQLNEFEQVFRQFDKDLSNSLNSIEFKAALAALSVSLTDEEFKLVFDKVSKNRTEVYFQEFVNYLRSVTEDQASAEQVANAFNQLAASKPFLTMSDMQVAHLTQETIEFLTTVMPLSADGYDYSTYLGECFDNKQ